MAKDEEVVDLNKLTYRDLLIQLHHNVKELKEDVKELKKDQRDTELKVNSLETKAKTWGGVAGFLAALGISLLELLIGKK